MRQVQSRWRLGQVDVRVKGMERGDEDGEEWEKGG